jgi:hypothetical protein
MGAGQWGQFKMPYEALEYPASMTQTYKKKPITPLSVMNLGVKVRTYKANDYA